MTRSDTSHIESRIFAEAISTGELYDLDPEDFSVEEFSLLWRIAGQVKTQLGAFDVDLMAAHLLAQFGQDRREWLTQAATWRLGRPDLMPAYCASLKAARHGEALSDTLDRMSRVSGDPGDLREQCLDALNRLPITGRYKSVTMVDAMKSVVAEMDARFASNGLPGITTGLPSLDRLTGGWQGSDLTLIGARPAVGKTALMVALALTAARATKRVGIVSAEQPAGQLAQRMIAITGHLPAWKLRNPRSLDDGQWRAVSVAIKSVVDLPIIIFDASAPDMAAVRVAAKAFDASVIFVDYVQRLKGRGESSYDKVSSIARGLKELARDLETPVVALAQINRAGVSGAKMEHLKGSGDLEQEADCVMILERTENAEVATLDVVKNRHGPTGIINLVFRTETMLFGEQA